MIDLQRVCYVRLGTRDLEAEHVGSETRRALEIPCAKPDVANTLQVDHGRSCVFNLR